MDFSSNDADESSYGDLPTRPMRVKVLYSFDTENKTNCLARFPNTLNIPAVAIDENSQVGIIELKQCLQAVVSASPELISRLSDGDFTIYAFDYSECDTPLVGQGMLSAALASTAPVNESEKTMITGRVCKNIPAIFNNGVKETLEVKLRMVPMSRPAQSDAKRSFDSMRGISPAVSAGFDPNAWNASVQQNKAQQFVNDYFDFDAAQQASDHDLALVDNIFGLGTGSSGSHSGQHMAGGVGAAQTPTDAAFGFNPAFSAHPHSAPGSRSGSPMMGSESSSHNEHLRHQSFSVNPTNFADQSRPGSRASVRSEVQSSRNQRQTSQQPQHVQQLQQQNDVDFNEDGQPRKRAKVMQADWRGKSSFGSKSVDLRVTAATAASMHMHRPIPKRHGAPGTDLEPPPRVPTPVPQVNPMLTQQRPQQAAHQRSFLRQASTADSDFMSDFDQFSEAIMSSPEDESPGNSNTAEGTPQDIPSSPPVFSGFNQPAPSSPGLPTLPPSRMADSGYMSERGFNSGTLMEGFDEDENRSPDAQDYETAQQYQPRSHQSQSVNKREGSVPGMPPPYPISAPVIEMNVEFEQPGDMNQLPQKMLLDIPPPSRRRDGSQGPKASKSSQAHNPTAHVGQPELGAGGSQGPQSRRGSLALPSLAETVQGVPQKPALKRRPTKRSRLESYGSEAGSPAPSETDSRPRGPMRSTSSAPRRVIIKERLEKALASGGMPQFCTHCGAIETPTWRKLYVKTCEGKPSPLDYVEGEGETIGIEAQEHNEETGEITRYLIRKSMKKTKDSQPGQGFEDIFVCNPCGLWFNKFRNMRPSNKWNRKAGTRKRKQKTTDGQEFPTDGLEPQSEAFFTDQVVPEDGPESNELPEAPQHHAAPRPAPAPDMRPRASSMQPQAHRRTSADGQLNASQLNAALARQVQSSPVRSQGSQESPIEVDLTPKPTRRLLFPSPRGDGEVRTLDDNGQATLKATPPSSKGSVEKPISSLKVGIALTSNDVNVFEAYTSFDKENMAPDMDLDDALAHLFEGSPTALFKTPRKTSPNNNTTPRSQRQINHLLKTPTPASRKRKPLSPDLNAANNASAHIHDFMTSPSSSRYYLRSTPSRQDRTPGRPSQNNGAHEISPFTRHLTRMLSEPNDMGAFTSPSRAIDFSDLPTFTTPGRALNDMDWSGINEIMSSDFAAFDNGKGVVESYDRTAAAE